MATSATHSLVVAPDGAVLCQGWNQFRVYGQDLATSARGVLVRSLSGIVRVWAGGNRDLALKSDGTLYLWGPSGAAADFRVPTVMATFPPRQP